MNKKTTILFDANPLLGQKSGVGQFSERLLLSYAEAHKDDSQITAYYFNFMGRKDTSSLPKHSSIRYKEIRLLPTKLLSLLHRVGMQVPYELFLGFHKFDFAIFPNFVSIPSIRKIPYLLAVHDITFIDCPEYMLSGNQKYLSRFVPKSIKSASGVITISNFTKKRITQNYKISQEKIITLPIPYEPAKLSGSIRDKIRDLTKEKMILFVGTIEPRKNIENLVKGFTQLSENTRREYSLVLAGSLGWKTERIINTVEEASNFGSISVTGYVSEAERNLLYSKCELVCLVSHYEGFGMPILEAAHYNKPLVLSSLEVFKEIAGNSAYYCDGDNPSSIADSIMKSLTDKKKRIVKIDANWHSNIENLNSFIERVIRRI